MLGSHAQLREYFEGFQHKEMTSVMSVLGKGCAHYPPLDTLVMSLYLKICSAAICLLQIKYL